MSTNVRTRIRGVLEQHGSMPAAVSGLSDSANLYDAGLTSLACVSLMLALEDDFDLEFPDALLKRSTFETIGQLSMAIESLLGPA